LRRWTATSNLTVNGSAFTANLLIFTGAGNDSLIGGLRQRTPSASPAGHLTSGDTVTGNGGADTIQITDAAVVGDAAFTHVTGIETPAARDFTNSVALGVLAGTAIGTRAGATLTIDDTAAERPTP